MRVLFQELRRRLRWILGWGLAGAIVAGIVAFLLPLEYDSTISLMPPEQNALSSASVLGVLTGQLPTFSTGGGLLSQRTPGATFIGVLQSRTVEDAIVQRFDLRHVYGKKFDVDARKKLEKNTAIEEDKKDGIISITVTDHEKARARDMAAAYVQELNEVLNSASTSSARREREFLEQRLIGVKAQLAVSTAALGQFSSRNATLDPQKQAAATLDVAGKLQADLAAAESELASLKTVYTDSNVQVKVAQARVSQLRGQLNQVTGQGQTPQSGDLLPANQAFPSVRQLPVLGETYSKLAQDVEVQETVLATLQKQYELARVEEAKEIPVAKVLDQPELAEKKSGPKIALIAISALLISLFLAVLAFLVSFARRHKLRFAVNRDNTFSQDIR